MEDRELLGAGDLLFRGLNKDAFYEAVAKPILHKIAKQLENLCNDEKQLYGISWRITTETFGPEENNGR